MAHVLLATQDLFAIHAQQATILLHLSVYLVQMLILFAISVCLWIAAQFVQLAIQEHTANFAQQDTKIQCVQFVHMVSTITLAFVIRVLFSI